MITEELSARVAAAPPADAEQAHLIDEIGHEDLYAVFHAPDSPCHVCGKPPVRSEAR